jgi:hypothetical protein
MASKTHGYKIPTEWPLGKVAEIWWNDSMSHTAGWAPVQYYRDHQCIGPLRSVGYILNATEKSISLVQNQAAPSGHISQAIEIPTSEVVRIHVLDIDPWPNPPTPAKRPKPSMKSKTKSGASSSTRQRRAKTQSVQTIVAQITQSRPAGMVLQRAGDPVPFG